MNDMLNKKCTTHGMSVFVYNMEKCKCYRTNWFKICLNLSNRNYSFTLIAPMAMLVTDTLSFSILLNKQQMSMIYSFFNVYLLFIYRFSQCYVGQHIEL